MASALARGIGEPVLSFDPVRERAEALAAETGGRAVDTPQLLAAEADVVVLGHKPGQLHDAAATIPGAKAIVSILAGVDLATLREAYPDRPVIRIMPNTPAGIGKGVTAVAAAPADLGDDERAIREQVLERLGRCSAVVELPESQMAGATALFGVLPAYVAVIAEAMVDAAVRHGMSPQDAGRMTAAGIEGSAALLRTQGHDTLAVRRAVTSPGGSTARGLRTLDQHGIREAFQDAFDAAAGVS